MQRILVNIEPRNCLHFHVEDTDETIAPFHFEYRLKMPATKELINPDLVKERENCSFDVEEFSRFWIGSQAKLDEKRARGGSFFQLIFFFFRL